MFFGSICPTQTQALRLDPNPKLLAYIGASGNNLSVLSALSVENASNKNDINRATLLMQERFFFLKKNYFDLQTDRDNTGILDVVQYI